MVGRAAVGLLLAIALPAGAQEKIRIVNEGGIRDAWTLPPGATLAGPSYPARFAAAPVEACVGIGYLINPDGTTSDFTLVRTWSEDEPPERDAYWAEFAAAAGQALATWRFQPRPEVERPVPVYTVATFVFGAKDVQALRKRCTVANLRLRLLDLREDRKARRMMSQGQLANLDLDPLLEDRYRKDQRLIEDALRRTVPATQPPPPPPPPPPRPGSDG